MRKLLQNKAVVGVLSVVAVASVAANFVKLPRGRSATVNAREPDPVAPPTEASQPRGHGPAFSHLAAQPWRDMFPVVPDARDPFAPPVLATPAALPASRPAEAPAVPSFLLQATSIEDRRSFAVINQTVVKPGEIIAGYRLDQILPDHIRLSGPAGTITVGLNQTSPGPKAPTAMPANADLPASTGGPPSGRSKP